MPTTIWELIINRHKCSCLGPNRLQLWRPKARPVPDRWLWWSSPVHTIEHQDLTFPVMCYIRRIRERKRFIKLVIHSWYTLAVAHVSYVQSLWNVGIALRRYVDIFHTALVSFFLFLKFGRHSLLHANYTRIASFSSVLTALLWARSHLLPISIMVIFAFLHVAMHLLNSSWTHACMRRAEETRVSRWRPLWNGLVRPMPSHEWLSDQRTVCLEAEALNTESTS